MNRFRVAVICGLFLSVVPWIGPVSAGHEATPEAEIQAEGDKKKAEEEKKGCAVGAPAAELQGLTLSAPAGESGRRWVTNPFLDRKDLLGEIVLCWQSDAQAAAGVKCEASFPRDAAAAPFEVGYCEKGKEILLPQKFVLKGAPAISHLIVIYSPPSAEPRNHSAVLRFEWKAGKVEKAEKFSIKGEALPS